MIARVGFSSAAALCVSLPCSLAAQPPAPAAAALPAPGGKPKWEVGLVAGGGAVADYPGADQTHARGLVSPLVIYRGPVLRVDEQGIRGRLFGRSDLELDFTAQAAFNARDNEARAGMPGLDYMFGVGPQLVYKGFEHAPGAPTVHLKAHALASTDFSRVDGRGGAVSVEVSWRRSRLAGVPGNWTFGIQPTWASRGLQRYFYEVRPEHATPERPAYVARAGYFGTELKLTLTRAVKPSLWWFFGVRAMSLHGAANGSSPLLRRDFTTSLGAGIVWTPWRSDTMVTE